MAQRAQPGWGLRLPTLLSCGAVAFSLLGGSLRAQEWIPEQPPAPPVRVIWFPNPPFAMDEKGVPAGLEIDLWRMVAETRQIPYEIKKAPSFKALLAAIRSGDADVGISGVLINENRSKSFHFSFPTTSSSLKLYTLEKEESTALQLLHIILSKEVIFIFLGLVLIACLFASPVWLLERHRADFAALNKRQQFVLILQKTLLLSTDHTKRTKTRLISIGSLFARVLLTAYFASYVLQLASQESLDTTAETMPEMHLEHLQNFTFAAIPGSIQTSILKSNGAKIIDCDVTRTCIAMLQKGEVNAILDDEQTMKTALSTMPATPKVAAASEELMPLFMAFAISNNFNDDPRSRQIDDAISRSYYDGTYTKLQQHWLND
jgi:ABC-type amino acid transport substrate-binding protein